MIGKHRWEEEARDDPQNDSDGLQDSLYTASRPPALFEAKRLPTIADVPLYKGY